MDARACLFYGVVLKSDQAKKLIKKLSKIVAKNANDPLDFEDDIYEDLEFIGEQLGFEVAILSREGLDPCDQIVGICAFEKTIYDWDGAPIIHIPDNDELDKAWEEVKKITGIKTKPRFRLFTEFC